MAALVEGKPPTSVVRVPSGVTFEILALKPPVYGPTGGGT